MYIDPNQNVGIQIGVYCDLLVAICFCFERYFMFYLSNNNQANGIEALNSTSKYLDYLHNIDYHYFE